MIDEAFNTFGRQAFQHAVFYRYETGLRFELSHGDTAIERFQNAYHRASDVVHYVFDGLDRVFVCLALNAEVGSHRSLLSVYSFLKELRDCAVWISRPFECRTELLEEEDSEEIHRSYLIFQVENRQLRELLWGCLGRELGIRPSFLADMYLFDLDLKILCHPYDDRGMDIVGGNRAKLDDLYARYRTWLLDYDLEKMSRAHSII